MYILHLVSQKCILYRYILAVRQDSMSLLMASTTTPQVLHGHYPCVCLSCVWTSGLGLPWTCSTHSGQERSELQSSFSLQPSPFDNWPEASYLHWLIVAVTAYWQVVTPKIPIHGRPALVPNHEYDSHIWSACLTDFWVATDTYCQVTIRYRGNLGTSPGLHNQVTAHLSYYASAWQ